MAVWRELPAAGSEEVCLLNLAAGVDVESGGPAALLRAGRLLLAAGDAVFSQDLLSDYEEDHEGDLCGQWYLLRAEQQTLEMADEDLETVAEAARAVGADDSAPDEQRRFAAQVLLLADEAGDAGRVLEGCGDGLVERYLRWYVAHRNADEHEQRRLAKTIFELELELYREGVAGLLTVPDESDIAAMERWWLLRYELHEPLHAMLEWMVDHPEVGLMEAYGALARADDPRVLIRSGSLSERALIGLVERSRAVRLEADRKRLAEERGRLAKWLEDVPEAASGGKRLDETREDELRKKIKDCSELSRLRGWMETTVLLYVEGKLPVTKCLALLLYGCSRQVALRRRAQLRAGVMPSVSAGIMLLGWDYALAGAAMMIGGHLGYPVVSQLTNAISPTIERWINAKEPPSYEDFLQHFERVLSGQEMVTQEQAEAIQKAARALEKEARRLRITTVAPTR